MIVLFVLACGGESPSEARASGGTSESKWDTSPTAYVYEGAAPTSVEPMAAEPLSVAVQDAFDAVRQIDPEWVVDGHAASIKLSDKTCPEFVDHNN